MVVLPVTQETSVRTPAHNFLSGMVGLENDLRFHRLITKHFHVRMYTKSRDAIGM